MRRVVLLVVGVLALAGCSSDPEVVVSYADYPAYSTPQEIVDAADAVVRGTVTGSRVKEDRPEVSTDGDPSLNPQAGLDEVPDVPGVVVTISTVRVEEVVKGDVAVGDLIEVAQLGGLYDGVQYVEAATTTLEEGSDYVLLLAAHGAEVPFDLLHPVQAMYTVDHGDLDPVAPDNEVAVDTLDELAQLAE
ncbi:hypothetical protein [Cellulomonas edaphi]|uniref:SAF domain-containing protein n=1 Tax=Cellulomonas edaphi TaxID=3053468 RepID=A0ABT7S2W5_9CELL|nr:hypothetical protein [Cellulomons edaphi]MDM7829964.1 hypothetical protein [Cellulomons edaphi]